MELFCHDRFLRRVRARRFASKAMLLAGWTLFLFCARSAEAEVIAPFTGGGPLAYTPGGAPTVVPGARAGICSHHGLVAKEISLFYESLKASAGEVRRVVVIGPDHFKSGHRGVTLCPADWRLWGGTLAADREAVRRLADTGAAGVETMPFRLEHSIGLHIYYIGQCFPQAAVVAMIINSSVSEFVLRKLEPVLSDLCGEGTLLILSMDFSHDKMPDEARREDDRSIERIASLDVKHLQGLDIDAPKATWLFLRTLRRLELTRPQLLLRTDSSVIAGRSLPCTSYAFMLFGPEQR